MRNIDTKTPYHFFVASYKTLNDDERTFTTLFSTKDDQVLHFGQDDRITYRRYLTDFQIVKDYGLACRFSDESDVICAQYDQDFPPETSDIETLPVKDVDGWLAPDGRFFKASWMDHSGLAFDLINSFYHGDSGEHGGDDKLYSEGWVCVAHHGMHMGWRHNIAPTEAQLAWLRRLKELNSNFEGYCEKIDRFLNMAKRYH